MIKRPRKKLLFNDDQINFVQLKNARTGVVHVSTKNIFFATEIIVKFDQGKITFLKPTIDYAGPVYRFFKGRYNKFYSQLKMPFVIEGVFEFDKQDSNEDQLVVYLDKSY